MPDCDTFCPKSKARAVYRLLRFPLFHPRKLIRRQDRLRELLPRIQAILLLCRTRLAQEIRTRAAFNLGRLAAIGQPKRGGDAVVLARRKLFEPPGERLRGFDREIAVQDEKLLL